MATVINRTTFEIKTSVSRSKFPLASWIHDPSLVLLLGLVLVKYWKVMGNDVLEMTQPEKDIVDAAELAAHNELVEQALEDRTDPHVALRGIPWNISTSGLVITLTIDTLIVDDEITVSVDSSQTTYARACLVRDLDADELFMVVHERLDDELYDELDENLVDELGEWSVVANGTDLVGV